MLSISRAALPSAALLAVLALTAPSAHAQLIRYNSLSSFQTAFPTTTLEDFEDGTSPENVGNGPLDSTTNDGVFAPGQIAPGLRLDFVGTSPNEYYYGTYLGATNPAIITNQAPNAMNVILTTGNSTALGFNLFNGSYTYQVFSSAGTSLGSGTVNTAQQSFLGFSDTTNGIGRVLLTNPSFEAIDNVRFNGTIAAAVAAPEPSALALLTLPFAGLILRRRVSR